MSATAAGWRWCATGSASSRCTIQSTGKSIRFASTLPALLAAGGVDTSIDPVALHHYMTFHAVVPPPHTIIKGVRKIEPGTVTVFEPDGRRSTERFWSLSFARTSEETRRHKPGMARPGA